MQVIFKSVFRAIFGMRNSITDVSYSRKFKGETGHRRVLYQEAVPEANADVRYNGWMLGLLFSDPMAFVTLFIGLVISITIHEFAHAWTADCLGDPTPRSQGRVTLNPLSHLDPIGTIMLLVTRFGWGKPVEFDPYNLKEPVRDTALIALAGPLSNIILAMLLAILIRFNFIPIDWLVVGTVQVIFINVVLAIFNLIPVYPLDGSKILLAVLPRDTALEYDDFMHRYGMFVLLAMILPWAGGTSPVSALISPIISTIVSLLLGV